MAQFVVIEYFFFWQSFWDAKFYLQFGTKSLHTKSVFVQKFFILSIIQK